MDQRRAQKQRANPSHEQHYVYHLQSGRDAETKEVTTATVSRTELARLQRSLNLQLRIVENKDKRGIHVDWGVPLARRHDLVRCPQDLWKGSTPEKIEAAIYGGLSAADQERLERFCRVCR